MGGNFRGQTPGCFARRGGRTAPSSVWTNPEGRFFFAGKLSEGAADDRVIRVFGLIASPELGWQVFARKGFLVGNMAMQQVASIDLRRCNRTARRA